MWRDHLNNQQPVSAVVGDYDVSGTVNTQDYNVWKTSFGAASGQGMAADGNHNGTVDAADYTVWRDNLGAMAGGGSALAASEPTARAPMTSEPARPAVSLALEAPANRNLTIPGDTAQVFHRRIAAADRALERWVPSVAHSLFVRRTHATSVPFTVGQDLAEERTKENFARKQNTADSAWEELCGELGQLALKRPSLRF